MASNIEEERQEMEEREDGSPVKGEEKDVEKQLTTEGDLPVTLSKSQLKKIKKKEKWAQVKASKRKAEKERWKARKRECRERGEELGPTRKQLKHNTMAKSNCKIPVVIDCDFDQYMAEKDIKMLVKQIQFSYSANRRSDNPMQLHCCGVSGKTQERLQSLGDYRGWDVHFHTAPYRSMFEKPSLVYLSSESPNVLQTLEEDKVYVIGGLVDHNHHKGLCHRLAEEKGITHAQLPISDYIDMKTRKVLTINHVFEILLRYTETKDWQKAFYTVLPPRKGAKPKDNLNKGALTTKEDSSPENLTQSADGQRNKSAVTQDLKSDSAKLSVSNSLLADCVSAEEVDHSKDTSDMGSVSDNISNVSDCVEDDNIATDSLNAEKGSKHLTSESNENVEPSNETHRNKDT
ncbi:tRNA methyltransferase 10 homolog A-like isoform X2 [Mya arenaria]|nr:tRNA methyltransferase 10 homolog A-like isoform X2 [Mya arenaria]